MNYSLQGNICRTCLVEGTSVKSIFNFEKAMGYEIQLCDMLMAFSSLVVVQGDGLPENICLNCSRQVTAAYSFKKLCETSDTTLRESFRDCNKIIIVNLIKQEESEFDDSVEIKSLGQGKGNECKDYRSGTQNVKTEINKTVHKAPISLHNVGISDRIIEPMINNFSLATFHKAVEEPCKNTLIHLDGSKHKETNKGDGEFVVKKSILDNDSDVKDSIVNSVNDNLNFKIEKIEEKEVVRSNSNSWEKEISTKTHKNRSNKIKKSNQVSTNDTHKKASTFLRNLEQQETIQGRGKAFLCNVCGNSFTTMYYLKIHSLIHTGEKPYKCKICGRGFSAPATLSNHVRIHTGERPYICKICGKSFKQAGYMPVHMRTHTSGKPITCKVCNAKFIHSGLLNIHRRSHSGEKPFQCTTCGRSFARSSTLKKHIRTHTGERPYKCEVCDQAFAQSGTLATHMKVHKSKI